MYGMIPNANTATLSKLPPVKVLTKPRSVPCMACMNSTRAWGSIPGVGILQPIR